jgi:hypothetical protein
MGKAKNETPSLHQTSQAVSKEAATGCHGRRRIWNWRGWLGGWDPLNGRRGKGHRRRRSAAATATSAGTGVVKATIPIVPTLYPEEPDGAVIVHNHITINIHNVEFREFNSKLDDVIRLLRISNEISGETRDQLIAEIKAGRALLAAPKPDAQLIELLLRRPLLFIGKTASGAIIGVAATAAVALLGKLTGLW